MKKYITLFAMLLMVSLAFAQNTISNTKSDVTVTIPDADFYIQDLDGRYSSHIFTFQGFTADSATQVYIYFKTSDFHAGTYPDSLLDKDLSYMVDSGWHNYTTIVRTLTDPVITITDGTDTKYYNLTYSFVGDDSVHYNLDMTFQVPYEVTWHESVASDGELDKSKLQYNIHMIDFTDSLYHYNLRLDNEVAGWDTLRFAPEVNNDTCDFCVYDVADTNGYYLLYNHYSGWLAKTDLTDSTYRFVGEVLCRGDKKFYINCKRPVTAVEDVILPSYNVFAEANAIIVNNADGNRVSIYDANGRLIASSNVTSDNARFTVPTGIYFVRINGATTKVLVK